MEYSAHISLSDSWLNNYISNAIVVISLAIQIEFLKLKKINFLTYFPARKTKGSSVSRKFMRDNLVQLRDVSHILNFQHLGLPKAGQVL